MAPCEMVPTVLDAVGIRGREHAPLRHRIGLAVGRLEVRLEQDAPVEIARIADAGHRHVDAVARTGKGGKLRAHHDHRGVLAAHVRGRQGDPEAGDERRQGRAQERRRGRIALAVEAGDEPEPEDLVSPHPSHRGDVLDAHHGSGKGRGGQMRKTRTASLRKINVAPPSRPRACP